MNFNKKTAVFFTLSLCLIIHLFSQPVLASVIIKGMKADVDLTDILYQGRKITDETEIKKLCVDITVKYHTKGYTAFKIKSAVIKKDGSIELFFSDPVVENIFVNGADPGNGLIAGEIYTKTVAFNEFVLNSNIADCKKKYSIRKINIDLKRNINDNIDIYVSAEKRVFNGKVSAASDPVYGGLTSISALFDFASYMVSAEFDTTAEFRDTCYTKAGIDYIYKTAGTNYISLLLGAKYKEKEVYSDETEKILYDVNIFEVETGLILNKRATVISCTAFSSYEDYNNYSDADSGNYFPGISAAFKYNNRDYMLDPLDIVTAETKSFYLWNPVEKNMVLRISLKGHLTVPVADACSLSAFIASNYTSEDKKIFHEYVFDRTLPIRNREYITAKWRHVLRPGLLFDLYNGIIYLSPEYNFSIYKNYCKKESVHAASLKGVLKTDFLSSEVAYTLEIGEALKEGVFTFEASALF